VFPEIIIVSVILASALSLVLICVGYASRNNAKKSKIGRLVKTMMGAMTNKVLMVLAKNMRFACFGTIVLMYNPVEEKDWHGCGEVIRGSATTTQRCIDCLDLGSGQN
jgi:hypothetical protein